jgi:tagaturonate epimerase
MATSCMLANLDVFPQSPVLTPEAEFAILRGRAGIRLAVLAKPETLQGFEGDCDEYAGRTLLIGPASPRNATEMRARLPWLNPRPLGLCTSAGMGDRIGLATPGHVRAVRAVGDRIAPIFAQQSIREMNRTDRSPQQVMDDATWGIFQEGWREGAGADADHLKTTADIDACLACGYTFFTVDPGEHVDNRADAASAAYLRSSVEGLPWKQLEDSAQALRARFLAHPCEVEGRAVRFDEESLLRAATKYGRAVAHVTAMYRHLVQSAGNRPFELEVSVDETETPTTHAEHVYVATELKRLGVRWVSMAPRYVGQFEKAVDYIGNVGDFEADVAIHAAIARQLGPYKLSIHSGSDKFSIYPAMMRQTRGLVHLKTAGTSYLEALRTIAPLDHVLFREIYAFARERFESDRASYHTSASLARAPLPQDVPDADLVKLLDQSDARQILHITFGSVLREKGSASHWRFHERLMDLLRIRAEEYAHNLEAHFVKHLRPFVAP